MENQPPIEYFRPFYLQNSELRDVRKGILRHCHLKVPFQWEKNLLSRNLNGVRIRWVVVDILG
jgi:hypothetical protein